MAGVPAGPPPALPTHCAPLPACLATSRDWAWSGTCAGPAEPPVGSVPDLTDFRASISLAGEPLGETVVRERRDARY
jgi:hypothetical protein